MVAKSYQNMEQLTDPYRYNGRMYVDIKTKAGATKRVQWYSDNEYAKMYPEDKVDKAKDPSSYVSGQDALSLYTSCAFFYGNQVIEIE